LGLNASVMVESLDDDKFARGELLERCNRIGIGSSWYDKISDVIRMKGQEIGERGDAVKKKGTHDVIGIVVGWIDFEKVDQGMLEL